MHHSDSFNYMTCTITAVLIDFIKRNEIWRRMWRNNHLPDLVANSFSRKSKTTRLMLFGIPSVIFLITKFRMRDRSMARSMFKSVLLSDSMHVIDATCCKSSSNSASDFKVSPRWRHESVRSINATPMQLPTRSGFLHLVGGKRISRPSWTAGESGLSLSRASLAMLLTQCCRNEHAG